jgi:hypothetical protein
VRAFRNKILSRDFKFFLLCVLMGVAPFVASAVPTQSPVVRMGRVEQPPVFEDFVSMQPPSEAATHMTKIALSLRVIAQYNATLSNQRLTSLQTSKRLDGDVLLVGYNSSLANIDPALIPTSSGLLRRNSPFINDGREFFVKISYLFRY